MSSPKRKVKHVKRGDIRIRVVRRAEPDLDRMRRALLQFVLDEQAWLAKVARPGVSTSIPAAAGAARRAPAAGSRPCRDCSRTCQRAEPVSSPLCTAVQLHSRRQDGALAGGVVSRASASIERLTADALHTGRPSPSSRHRPGRSAPLPPARPGTDDADSAA